MLAPDQGTTVAQALRVAVRAVWLEQTLRLDEPDPATGRLRTQIELESPDYDLVVATERMAQEAATVGCAVVVCDGCRVLWWRFVPWAVRLPTYCARRRLPRPRRGV